MGPVSPGVPTAAVEDPPVDGPAVPVPPVRAVVVAVARVESVTPVVGSSPMAEDPSVSSAVRGFHAVGPEDLRVAERAPAGGSEEQQGEERGEEAQSGGHRSEVS